MFGRLLRKKMVALPGSIPAGQAVYAVGDIHGRSDLFDRLLGLIATDAARHAGGETRSLILLGDYIDRGPTSREVVERLVVPPLEGFSMVCLKGNHEDALLAFLDGATDGLDWLSYGGLETLMSYGVPLRGLPNTLAASVEMRRALAAAVPRRHLEFFRECGRYHQIGDYTFVHAGVRPGIALDEQDSGDLMWIRDDFLRSRNPLPGHVVVHGHTIVDEPQDRGYRINIDTGAFVSGRLTCLVLREQERRFITTLDA